jgi:hypothetical protein
MKDFSTATHSLYASGIEKRITYRRADIRLRGRGNSKLSRHELELEDLFLKTGMKLIRFTD